MWNSKRGISNLRQHVTSNKERHDFYSMHVQKKGKGLRVVLESEGKEDQAAEE